ncbi:MAG: response regulator [Phycisphaeraceae bacterium]|nr:response regulator [Phycisphaeraceae bacterium]MCW5753785.1 response regulator [Phycisphaeraceae bacterium]
MRFHPQPEDSAESTQRDGCAGVFPGEYRQAGASPRLNLLLSYAGWQRDSWADRLPLLLEPMGVRALRADSGKQATDVLQSYPIHIAVVDLALPLDPTPGGVSEEGGFRLLEILARLASPPPTVVVKRAVTHRDESRELAAALRSGAFAVVERPRDLHGLETMLDVLRRALIRFYRGRWPGGLA